LTKLVGEEINRFLEFLNDLSKLIVFCKELWESGNTFASIIRLLGDSEKSALVVEV